MYSDKPSCSDRERVVWRSKDGDKAKNKESDPEKKRRQSSKHSCLLLSCTTGNAGQPSYRGFPDLILNKITSSLPVWPQYKYTPPQDLITLSKPEFYKYSISIASTKAQFQLRGNAEVQKELFIPGFPNHHSTGQCYHYRPITTLFSLYCTSNNIKILYYEYPITI